MSFKVGDSVRYIPGTHDGTANYCMKHCQGEMCIEDGSPCAFSKYDIKKDAFIVGEISLSQNSGDEDCLKVSKNGLSSCFWPITGWQKAYAWKKI